MVAPNNGHMTAEQFRDQANRKKSVARLDELWEDFNRQLPPEAAEKVLPKATRVYDVRRRELDTTTKSKAQQIIHSDTKINRKCLVGKTVCAVLSGYLNAQASVLGFKHYCLVYPDLFKLLEGTTFPGTGITFAIITERMALVYGCVIPALVLILWTVAGMLWKRGVKRPAMGCFAGGGSLLLLSLKHCTDSLMLFGLPWPMAFAYAVALDWGLVSLEMGSLFSSDDQEASK